uniref:Uncharacterized protein n=1 Tax=Lactuca sativa TaxID=4236 RepID=A0A9R1UT28_LACSA|nr:hypothetical protein LSAT_V11C800438450 [Lactuca sativa]
MNLFFNRHLHGTSLGGFLALLFAQHRPPRRVKSLILSNAFLDTKYFLAAMPWVRVYTPSFMLKQYVLTGIPNGPHEPFVANSVDFVVADVSFINTHNELFPNNLKKKINILKLRPWGDLASRLTLISDVASVGPLRLSDSLITIMDVEVKMLLISS